MSEYVEVARFRVEPSRVEGMLEAWPRMVSAMKQAYPTLKTVELVRFEDGTWADIATWSDAGEAAEACTMAESLPAVQEFFAHIAEDVSMDQGEIRRRL